MRLGVIGRGYWGDTYCRTLKKMGVSHWQDGRYWHIRTDMDAVIVATSTESHYQVARTALGRRYPVLVEKPACTSPEGVRKLLELGGIAFAGHTRLYSPAWRAFKASLPEVRTVEGFAGGTNETNPNTLWNWGPHLVSMSFDLGCESPNLWIESEREPLRIVVNDEYEFVDCPTEPTALEVLLGEFIQAVKDGQPNNSGLAMGLKVMEYLCRSPI
jgi:hypothetical protein